MSDVYATVADVYATQRHLFLNSNVNTF